MQAATSLQLQIMHLRDLALELARTEQRQKKRLSEVLHNDLQQLLIAAGWRLNRLANTENDPVKRSAIEQIDALIGRSLTSTQSLAIDLRPPILASGNLAQCLHWLADWLRNRCGFALTFAGDEHQALAEMAEHDLAVIFQTVKGLCVEMATRTPVSAATLRVTATSTSRLQLRIDAHAAVIAPDDTGQPPSVENDPAFKTLGDQLILIGGELAINDSAPERGLQLDLVFPYALLPSPPPGIDRPGDLGGEKLIGHCHENPAFITVLLADDHAVVRDGLKMILQDQEDIRVVGEAGNGEEAISLAEQLLPDAIVMDVNMPKMNGIKATEIIRRRLPATSVIALTINDDPGTKKALLDAGSYAILNKADSTDKVCEALRACKRNLAANWREQGGRKEERGEKG